MSLVANTGTTYKDTTVPHELEMKPTRQALANNFPCQTLEVWGAEGKGQGKGAFDDPSMNLSTLVCVLYIVMFFDHVSSFHRGFHARPLIQAEKNASFILDVARSRR